MTTAHRVLLVRERASGAGGTGCCAGGELFDEPPPAGPQRIRMQAIGAIYRALRAELPDVDVQIVEPGNIAWLVPAIWRDARRRGLPRADAWRQVCRGAGDGAIVVDGCVISCGAVPEPHVAVAAVRAALRPASR